MNIIKSGNFNLQYKIEGQGINTIVIGSAVYYPRTFSSTLRNNFRFIFLDHRGFAKANSAVTKESCTLEQTIDDIELARQQLNLGKIIIVGHSGHGFMALEYAKKYPDHVSYAILIGMGSSNSHENHQLSNQYFDESVCPERKKVLSNALESLAPEIEKAPEKAFITYCIKLGARSWYDYNFDASALWDGVEVNMPIMDYLWGEVFRDIDITKNSNLIKCPIFLALGKYDYLVAPFYTWDKIRHHFNNLTVRLFEKSSHTPQYEEPEKFDQSLLDWLNIKNIG